MSGVARKIRNAEIGEVGRLAAIWYAGWQDAHATILPGALSRARTRDSFEDRLREHLAIVRVVGARGQPTGFCMVRDDELYQLYVADNARGSGAATALVDDAENILVTNGVSTAWLACAIGNERAARFYEKCGWTRRANMINRLDTIDGPFDLKVWRYEKRLAIKRRKSSTE